MESGLSFDRLDVKGNPMNLRAWSGPLALAAGIVVANSSFAQGGVLERHWEAYAALGSANALHGAVWTAPISFQFTTRSEGHDIALTDVHVTIACAVGGKLFEAVSEGPFLIANLPEGRYDVVAWHEGRARRVALVVAGAEPRQVALRW